MSYYNYDGTLAVETPSVVTNIYGSTAGGETLTGTSSPTGLWAEGPNDLLNGVSGSDTFFVQSYPVQIQEVPGGSAEIVAWANTDLSRFSNISNASIGGTNTYIAGSAQNNVLFATGSNQQLFGGGGQDVLVGNGQSDTFIIIKGQGNEAIYNFNPATDVVRLTAGLTSFGDVQSHLIQSGADVKLDLGGGDGAVFRNMSVSQFTASNFQLQLDTAKLGVQTFNDDFNKLSLWNGTSGTWTTTYNFLDPNGNGGTLASNGEQEWYINSNYAPTASVTPWTVSNGVLSLTVAPASPTISPLINNYKYTSGEVNTLHSFAQTYGYFEMRAELPHNAGGWPAFWLLPTDGSWPPELDVMETLSRDPYADYTTAHSNATGVNTQVQAMSYIPQTSDGYHTYGVLWTKTTLTWYVDGVQVFQAATPADMNKPMYMIANLALGGWGGTVDPTQLPAQMNIDYIRAYSLADGSSVTTLDTVPAPAQGGTAAAPAAPTWLADAAVVGGYVNKAADLSTQSLTGTAQAGAAVTVWDGATKLGVTTADAITGQWSYTLGQLADGAHSLSATATDSSGAVSAASAALTFTVDTQPPAAPTGLADAAISGGYVNAAANSPAQALTGMAEAGSTVIVYDGTTRLGTTIANSTGAWSYSLGGLADGPHALRATATDPAGNVGPTSSPLSFAVDTTAPPTPAVADIAYDPSSKLATVRGWSEPGAAVKLFDKGSLVGSATVSSTGAWAVVTRVQPNGVHSFTETVSDVAGNTATSGGVALFDRSGSVHLVGGTGDDVLIGMPGDTLTGGAGHNEFVFNPKFGAESVTDFKPAGDVVAFDHTLFSSFTSVMQHALQVGASVIITFDAGDTVTLQNTALTSLQAGNFIFL